MFDTCAGRLAVLVFPVIDRTKDLVSGLSSGRVA